MGISSRLGSLYVAAMCSLLRVENSALQHLGYLLLAELKSTFPVTVEQPIFVQRTLFTGFSLGAQWYNT